MQPKQNEHVKECIVCSHLTPNTLDVLARTGQRRESNAKTAKSSWGSWRNSMEVSKEPWDGQLIVPSPILSPANEELELDQQFSVFFFHPADPRDTTPHIKTMNHYNGNSCRISVLLSTLFIHGKKNSRGEKMLRISKQYSLRAQYPILVTTVSWEPGLGWYGYVVWKYGCEGNASQLNLCSIGSLQGISGWVSFAWL